MFFVYKPLPISFNFLVTVFQFQLVEMIEHSRGSISQKFSAEEYFQLYLNKQKGVTSGNEDLPI